MNQRMVKRNRAFKWSELSPDLLRCVFTHLSVTDLNRAKSVCSSWHSASRGCIPKRNQIPWLILFPREEKENNSSSSSSSSCVLYIPDDRDRVYKTRDLGIDFVRSCCLAVYSSWLLMMDPMWNLNILNPLTGERIDLPHTESVVPGWSRTSRLKSSVACLWVDEKSKDYLVVWKLNGTFMSFTKKGMNNNKWRKMLKYPVLDKPGEDMVYDHKAQKLYVYRNGEPEIETKKEAETEIVIQTPSETSQATTRSEFPYNSLSQTTAPASGFAWAGTKKRKENDVASTLTYNQPAGSASHVSGTSMAFAKNTFGLTINEEKPSFLRPHVSLDSSEVLLFSGVHNKKTEENMDLTNLGANPKIFQTNGMNEILRKTESDVRVGPVGVRRPPRIERG